MSLSQHVATLGRGPGRSRSLTLDEACDAMAQMLTGDAAPQAVGAILMLLRMKGETAEEIAGFVRAAQDSLPEVPPVDLDWPSYAAGRTRGLPWFLLSARLLAGAGHRVLLHGWNGRVGSVRAGLGSAGIRQAKDIGTAADVLASDGITYLPLEHLATGLFALLQLRDTFGLRSCVNTVCRMLNPGRAAASVQGVFHPSYRLLQADAAGLLGWSNLSVIKGGGGEFERHPSKVIAGFGLREGAAWEGRFAALHPETRRLDDGAEDPARLADLWTGRIADPFAEAIVIGTAAAALATLGVGDAEQRAADLWRGRARSSEGDRR
ncbi:glycosyl transferase family protein [Pseudooceanicola sp.]|uniref:glycosyl transferase family protein n=1 Tax=Pseudooceanicola sp. TaxID=1914328 RepID=UPI0026378D50|nr:glycosyl transferase family protein [Pseudooceanicola sp.]MDF1855052.1 glycosyl transferase family protein [Pseudooceanicola sp.]